MVRITSQKQEEAIAVLKRTGWSDTAVAEALSCTINTIARHRKRLGVPSQYNESRRTISDSQALELYNQGMSDAKIAEKLCCHQTGIRKWRIRNGLAANFKASPRLTEESKKEIRKFVRQGASSTAIMRRLGVSKQSVLRVRARMKGAGMRESGITDEALRRSIRKDCAILERIEQAIGLSTPRHVRDHAVHDMYGDLLECLLSVDQIEKRASSYRSRAYSMCGSDWSAVRLDAPDDNGLTLVDRLTADVWDPEEGWQP